MPLPRTRYPARRQSGGSAGVIAALAAFLLIVLFGAFLVGSGWLLFVVVMSVATLVMTKCKPPEGR